MVCDDGPYLEPVRICLSCEGVAATEQERCAHCDVPLLPTSAVHFPVRRGEVDAANPLLGTVIDGKYLIQGVLGRGGMGTVFRACHAVSLVPVALKLLHPRLSVLPEYRRALLGEARKAGRVVHEQCARVLDVGETEEGTVYLAMELAEGETLDALVRARALPPGVVVDVLVQICRALVAIHGAGLVHRDLSSRNVMVSVREGAPVVKVLDFGIAQSLAFAPRAAEEAGAGAGERAFANPVFSAPEHLAGQEVDARADVYSLGVVAYLLLSGRLPVDQQDSRAAARDTVAGRLRPLQPLPGFPRRLVRLVQRCLLLDRERRPPSARAVLAELQALQAGHFAWLPRASLAAFAAATVVAIATFARATPPFLRLQGSRLELVEGGLPPDAEVLHLHSRHLSALRLYFGGFRPELLEIELTQGNQLLDRKRLSPAEVGDGVLLLSTAQRDWQDVVDGLARRSADGAVDLALLVPGLSLLGSARVRIDDTPPEVRLELAGDGAGRSLHGSSRVQVHAHDQVGLSRVQLSLHLASAVHEFELEPGEVDVALGERLAGSLQERLGVVPVHDLGPAELRVRAVDLADNAGELGPGEGLQVDSCDLRAPTVQAVTGRGVGEGPIPWLDEGAMLRVRLSAAERDLRLSVVDPDGELRTVRPVPGAAGTTLDVDLPPGSGDEPFVAGGYTFTVEDARGNRSRSEHPLQFRNRRVDPVFVRGEGLGPVAVLGADELVLGPGGGALEFRCNPAFAVAGADLRAEAGGAAASGGAIARRRLEPGREHLELRPPAAGPWQLILDLEEPGGGARVQVQRRVHALPAQLLVQLPGVRSRFLPPLVRAGLFERTGDALRDGSGVRVGEQLRRFVRGTVWTGSAPGSLTAQPLPEPAPGDARLLPPIRILTGRNLIALELHDVLGRPVAVKADDQELARLDHDGDPRYVLADFVHDATQPAMFGEVLPVESGQNARLRLHSPLPFRPEDAGELKLKIAGGEEEVRAVVPTPGGSELVFVLPAAVWRTAVVTTAGHQGNLDDVPVAAYADGIEARLVAELSTPAGPHLLELPLRTTRSTLRVVPLGRAAPGPLPAPLADIVLVPVLAPVGGVLADPVPAAAPGRDLYRPQPEQPVRNLADLFVQDREFTMAQYACLLRELGARKPQAEGLWHAGDPQRAARLSVEHMVPTAWRGRTADFERAAGEAPAAAVTGVDFFQAYTAARLLGLLVAGDPALFRLPLGCELELAAFGGRAPGAARNGAAAQGGTVLAAPFGGEGHDSGARPGPTAADCRAAGDVVPAFGASRLDPAEVLAEITGLDFGLREWVFDLPLGDAGDDLLREWAGDRELHRRRAQELADGTLAQVAARLHLGRRGVVRGLPFGSAAGLLDAHGQPLRLRGLLVLPPSVPGVVRCEQLRRDGRDLDPGGVDPRLLHTGFRVVGGDTFVLWVRGR